MYLYRLLLKLKRKLPVIRRLSNGAFSVALLTVLAASTLTLYVGTRSSVNENVPYSIFILAGQSNAEGSNSYVFKLPEGTGFDKRNHPADTETGLWWAGANGSVVTEEDEIYADFVSGTAGWINSGIGNDTPLQDLTDVQLKNQFGSERGSGRTLYDMGRRKVVFLKVTYGFQSLAPSAPPFIPFDWNTDSVNKSYDRLKLEFEQLTDYIREEGSTYTVDGFFWMQGETDTIQTSYADNYLSYYETLVDRAFTDFEMHPSAHFVAGKISLKYCVDGSYPVVGEYCGVPYFRSIVPVVLDDLSIAHRNHAVRHRQVRDALQTVADNNPRVDLVETADLERGYDFIHLTEEAQLELGRRFVNMYNLPLRFGDTGSSARKNDYDNDGILNSSEDTGRGAECVDDFPYETAGNGNLGDDDADCDGFPNYLDALDNDGISSGL